jgi:anti-anti-sigma factor
LIITLLPELNDKQWSEIDKVGSDLVERLAITKSPRFLVDLTPLSYMGSAMVALIVRLYKSVNTRGGKMVVVNQHELVYEVLKLAGLAKLWTIVESREKGYAALGVSGRPAAVAGESVASGAGGGNALLVAGIIGTIGAVIGLALQFSPNPPLPLKYAQLVEFAFAALGMITGAMMLVNHTGARRNVGIAFLAVCLLIVLGGIVAVPDRGAPRGPANGAAATADTSSTAAITPIVATPEVPQETKVAATTTKTTAATPATQLADSKSKKDKKDKKPK